MWAQITTTDSAQTIVVQVLFGATSLLTIGTIQPNSGGTVTGTSWRFTGTVLFTDATHATTNGQLDMNHQVAYVDVQAATAVTPPGLLSIAYTPQQTAVSLTVLGGCWQRIA